MGLSPRRHLQALIVSCAAPCIYAFARIEDSRTWYSIALCALISYAGLLATRALVPIVKAYNLRAGLGGMDINKKGSAAGEKKVPESLGLASGVVFLVGWLGVLGGGEGPWTGDGAGPWFLCPPAVLRRNPPRPSATPRLPPTRAPAPRQVCMILFQQLHYYDVASFARWLGRGGSWWELKSVAAQPASDAWLVDYNAALAAICFMLFLGFADDVLDIPWRVKLALPCVAALPLLIAYSGGTAVVVPRPLRALGLAPRLELGPAYYLYMVALVIFCTNSINILAGVNGLEAGQTLVIAAAVLCHNLWQLAGPAGGDPEGARGRGRESSWGRQWVRQSFPGKGLSACAWRRADAPSPTLLLPFALPVRDGHLFSAYIMLPLISTSIGLLLFNWYPSQVSDPDGVFGGGDVSLSASGGRDCPGP